MQLRKVYALWYISGLTDVFFSVQIMQHFVDNRFLLRCLFNYVETQRMCSCGGLSFVMLQIQPPVML